MPNRIDTTFERLKANKAPAFIPFLTAGDPDLQTTEHIILGAQKAGADLIELGFPFSDPVADGATIQASYTRVLAAGQRVEDVFRLVESLRRHTDMPIVAMISYSLVFRMGFPAFLARACEAGLDGATIPDLPAEEMQPFCSLSEGSGFHLVCFVTPATTKRRRAMVLSLAKGFIYYISVRGITGERDTVPSDLMENLRQLKALSDLPVAVGFGISQPAQARAVAQLADGVIVGSAIVKRIHEAHLKGEDPIREAVDFMAEMARATKGRL